MIKAIKNSINLSIKTKITLISFLSFIFFFNIWRLIFFYSYIHEFNGGITLYIKSFLVGLRGDIFMASILSIPIFIISYIPKIKFNRKTKFVYYSYLFILYIAIGFLNVIDLEFFKELGAHINMMAQMYGFDTGGEHGEVWMQVWVSYPVFLYLFMIFFLSYLTYKIVKHNISKSLNTTSKGESIFIKYVLIAVLIITSTNIFQKNPFNPKKSFFSETDMMANHLAVNSIQNYIYSLTTTPDLTFYNKEKAYDVTKGEIKKNIISNNKNINVDLNSPNIILIVLESHLGAYTNYINSELKEPLSPFLDSLSKQGINFKNCYANGTRTAYGLSAIMCSWPVIPGYPLMRTVQYQDEDSKNPETFSSILKKIDSNYKNIFIYGGDSNFDEMKIFAESNEFDKIVDHTLDPELKKLKLDNFEEGVNPWGVFDHYLFERSIDIMSSNAKEQPTFITILSTTNHLPWVIPNNYRKKIPEYKSNKKDFNLAKKTITYVDNSLEVFFENAKRQDWFDDTIFIITADHGLNVYKEHINDPRNGRIPFIIYNSNLKPNQIDKIVSQIDILPTLLDLINQDEYFNDEILFGCSGLKGEKGFAFRSNDSNIQWIEDGYVYSYNIGIEFEEFYMLNDFKTSRIDSVLKTDYEKKCKAYAQAAYSKIDEQKRIKDE